MNSVADIWTSILAQLKQELSETTIATWFDELEAVDIRGTRFTSTAPTTSRRAILSPCF